MRPVLTPSCRRMALNSVFMSLPPTKTPLKVSIDGMEEGAIDWVLRVVGTDRMSVKGGFFSRQMQ